LSSETYYVPTVIEQVATQPSILIVEPLIDVILKLTLLVSIIIVVINAHYYDAAHFYQASLYLRTPWCYINLVLLLFLLLLLSK